MHGGDRLPWVAAAGPWTSTRERDAMTIERDADDIARAFALERALFEGGFEQTFDGRPDAVNN